MTRRAMLRWLGRHAAYAAAGLALLILAPVLIAGWIAGRIWPPLVAEHLEPDPARSVPSCLDPNCLPAS